MPKITQIIAREILDSRGTPTIEASVMTDTGIWGTASVPSGASTGKNEAIELRDNDPERYYGKGVLKAIQNITQIIAPKLQGVEVSDQYTIDKIMVELDGTDNKKKLGANATIAVSIAALKAAAANSGKPLFEYIHEIYAAQEQYTIPGSTFNLINGGKHGAGNLDFQEFHIIPSTRYTFHEALRMSVEITILLKQELINRGAIHSVGDEGGFAPNLFTNTDALELLTLVIKSSKYKIQQDIFLGLDVAANSFYSNGKYKVKDAPRALSRDGMINLYENLIRDYRLFSLEDPLDENDWEGWKDLSAKITKTTMLVGDDFLTTNSKKLKKAIEEKACNTILVKPNQVGTITETVNVVNLAKQNNINTIFSHRSGETNDTFIADFAVGLGANYTKFGAPIRGERVAKYNRLLEIESHFSQQ